MKAFMTYPGLSPSLRYFRQQVIDSLPYVVKNFPRFKTVKGIFDFCNSKFHYKSDPNGVEYFQTVQTLMKAGGEGDCDDATILTLATLLVNGFLDCGIYLAGHTPTKATHIYTYAVENGNEKILDLTTHVFDKQRPYKYTQKIPFKISKEQIDMFLQLADGEPRRARTGRLTDTGATHLFIPSKNVWVPEHHFDRIPLQDAEQCLLSEGYDENQLSGWRQRRQERHELKMEKKHAKNAILFARADKKHATADKRRSTGEARRLRGEAKRLRGERGEPGGGGGFFKKAGGFFKNASNPDNDNSDATDTDDTNLPDDEQTDQPDDTETDQPDDSEMNDGETFNVFGLQIPKPVAYVGGFALAAGIAYEVIHHRHAAKL